MLPDFDDETMGDDACGEDSMKEICDSSKRLKRQK